MNNRIVLGNGSTFENDSITSITTSEELSLTGADLAYDVMTADIHYELGSTSVLRPLLDDLSGYTEGIMTSDDMVISGHYDFDLRETPYGLSVTHYYGTTLVGVYYIESVDRTSAYDYRLNCISAIGLLDKQYSVGNVYFGKKFSEVAAEIIGSSITYEVDDEVKDIPIYGWLPYDTKRNNLKQLLFAVNAHVKKNADGLPVFGFINSSDYTEIPENRVYSSGSEVYPKLATKVSITEHSFFYNQKVEEQKVFDNSSDATPSSQFVKFSNAPIVANTLRTEGNITIVNRSVNGATIRGNGVIYGVPYVHDTSTVERTNNTGGDSYEISVTDATLVTVANSENVADRMMSYYSSATTVQAGIVYDGEKCGNRYKLLDAFLEPRIGIINKMEKKSSSFLAADCEIISDYSIGNNGNNYSNCEIISQNMSGTFESSVKKAKIVLIGGGNGGSSGLAGESSNETKGGKGGKAGTGGAGGKVLQFVVDNPREFSINIGAGGTGGSQCSSTETPNNGGNGGTTYIKIDGTTYYSDNGTTTANGVSDIFNAGSVFAVSGESDGSAGANGGDTSINYSSVGDGVDYNGTYYRGGLCGNGFNRYGFATGGAGGGASATGNGGNGGNSTATYDDQSSSTSDEFSSHQVQTYKDRITCGNGGTGSTPTKRSAATVYGKGGSGGHGGGGGGGHGATYDTNNIVKDEAVSGIYLPTEYGTFNAVNYITTFTAGHASETVSEGSNGAGGKGGAGGNGAKGCVIIYY